MVPPTDAFFRMLFSPPPIFMGKREGKGEKIATAEPKGWLVTRLVFAYDLVGGGGGGGRGFQIRLYPIPLQIDADCQPLRRGGEGKGEGRRGGEREGAQRRGLFSHISGQL